MVQVAVGDAKVIAYLLWNGRQIVDRQFVAQTQVGISINCGPHGERITLLAECEVDEGDTATLLLRHRLAHIDVPLGLVLAFAVGEGFALVLPRYLEVDVYIDSCAKVTFALAFFLLLVLLFLRGFCVASLFLAHFFKRSAGEFL